MYRSHVTVSQTQTPLSQVAGGPHSFTAPTTTLRPSPTTTLRPIMPNSASIYIHAPTYKPQVTLHRLSDMTSQPARMWDTLLWVQQLVWMVHGTSDLHHQASPPKGSYSPHKRTPCFCKHPCKEAPINGAAPTNAVCIYV